MNTTHELAVTAAGVTRNCNAIEPMFYYFAYGSCMCPVDLKRSLGENTHNYVIGPATLKGFRLSFNYYSSLRHCGVLDVMEDPAESVEGVLYRLPWRLSQRLDVREDIPHGGYQHKLVDIYRQGQVYQGVRIYVVVNKLSEELAPNDWYFSVVIRGAVTCGLSEEYCWKLFNHMYQLQQRHQETQTLRKEKILVCQRSGGCLNQGGEGLCQALEAALCDRGLQNRVTIERTGCLKRCSSGPNLVSLLGKKHYSGIQPDAIAALLETQLQFSNNDKLCPL